MQIDKKLLAKWKELRITGDTKTIAANAGVTMPTVQAVLRTGEINNEKLLFEMTSFFKNRENKLKKVLA